MELFNHYEHDGRVRDRREHYIIDICAYVETRFGVCYRVSGMTKWLKARRFSYKQPKATPVYESDTTGFSPQPRSFVKLSTWAKIAPFLRGRINDNFQTIDAVPSS
ncbi:helix-turn-helix domain-containing protein [Candidatus Fukatsuia symbiotica]|uniref:helix-turn-helix domain-containing protein n=1 Tax=Candidatus Fukatsuia symbiotica TaxID=1878942 RepID=UPI0013C32323